VNYLELLKIELPASQKAVFIAIAIRQGANKTAFPSVERLAKDTGFSVRTVQSSLRALEKSGHIMTCSETGKTSKYSLTKSKQDLHPTPATIAPQPPQPSHPEVSNINLDINNGFELSKESGEKADQNPISFNYRNNEKEMQIQDEREQILALAHNRSQPISMITGFAGLVKQMTNGVGYEKAKTA